MMQRFGETIEDMFDTVSLADVKGLLCGDITRYTDSNGFRLRSQGGHYGTLQGNKHHTPDEQNEI